MVTGNASQIPLAKAVTKATLCSAGRQNGQDVLLCNACPRNQFYLKLP